MKLFHSDLILRTILGMGLLAFFNHGSAAQEQRPEPAGHISGFNDDTSLANWQLGGGATASIETDAHYVRTGQGSLKVTVPRQSHYANPNYWDYHLGVTNSKVGMPVVPLGVSFWVYPVNTNALTLSLAASDGTQASWEYYSLKMNQWNLVRLMVSDGVISKGKEESVTFEDVNFIGLGVLKGVLWQGFADQSQPAIYYFDDVEIITGALSVAGHTLSSGETEPTLQLAESHWQGEVIEGHFNTGTINGEWEEALGVTITGSDGTAFEAGRPVRVFPGVNHLSFSLSPELPEGHYTLKVHWRSQQFRQSFRVMGLKAIERRRRLVELSRTALTGMVNQWQREQRDVAYPRAALAVADRFINIELPGKTQGLNHFEGRTKLMQAGVDMEHCREILDSAIADMKRGRERKVPQLDMSKVTLEGSTFYAEGKPVVLLGPLGWNYMWEDIDNVGAMGFNIIDDQSACTISKFAIVMLAPGTWGYKEAFFDIQRAYPIKLMWQLLDKKNVNVALSFNPETHYVPGWLHQEYPETKPDGTWEGLGFVNYPMESEIMKELVAKYYAGLIPLAQQEPKLLYYWLKNEPTYWSHTARYKELFQGILEKKYQDVSALNNTWKTDFSDFASVEFPENDNKAAWYDWSNFHYNQVTDYFRWQHNEVKKHAPDALTGVKPVAGQMYQEAFTDKVGIDFEVMAEIYEVPTCDTFITYSNQNPTCWLVNSGTLLYDLWQSVAPNKPYANTEFHQYESSLLVEYLVDRPEHTRYVQTTYWQQYFHGARINTFWTYTNSDHYYAITGKPVVIGQPTALHTTACTALDLRRLAGEVSAFPGPAEVALYYSKPSLFLDGLAHLQTLSEIYTALFYQDAPVGFVTDKLILKGIDPRVKLVVIPQAQYVREDVCQALLRYAQSGGRVVVVGTSFGFDEKNRPRDAEPLKTVSNIQWIEPGQMLRHYWRLFDGMFEKLNVKRPIRVVGEDNKPVWRVESRTVDYEDKRLTYLINLDREDKSVKLTGTQAQRFKDLIEDELLPPGPIKLQPWEVRLFAVDAN